mgnify:FL=1
MTKLKLPFVAFIIALFLSLSQTQSKAEKECFEKVSRSVFKFNTALDNTLLGPVARLYNKLPQKVKEGTGNVTSNIGRLLSVPNHLLQGNVSDAADSFGAFTINLFFGIGGLNDVASAYLEPTQEDLSQTLGVYGVKNGCYFVLPVLGPTTVRDTAAMVGDTFLDPFATMTWRQKEVLNETFNKSNYVLYKGADAIDFRGDNDTNIESLKKNSIDLYAATKSLYLQNKKNKIENSTGNEEDGWGNLDK